ncbi:MAG: hypothetical protein HYV63_03980 [Candidatus Schekmanbacteria bacterium]|nr:hypothetical protein [Candidatus Schekmanbacteria bacterium]
MTLLGMARVPRLLPLEELVAQLAAARADRPLLATAARVAPVAPIPRQVAAEMPRPELPAPPAPLPTLAAPAAPAIAAETAPPLPPPAAPQAASSPLPPPQAPSVSPATPPVPDPEPAAVALPPAPLPGVPVRTATEVWPSVVEELRNRLGHRTASELRLSVGIRSENATEVALGIRPGPRAQKIADELRKSSLSDLAEAFSRALGRPLIVTVAVTDKSENVLTQLDLERCETSAEAQEQEEFIRGHPLVQKAQRLFDATLERSSR